VLDPDALLPFAALSLAVALSPGPSWLYVIQSTLTAGRRGSLWSILGNGSGILCHLGAVALGLAALLQTSDLLFLMVKLAGAGYLVWLGVRTLLAPELDVDGVAQGPTRSAWGVYRDGVIMAVLNPKISLLMLALLPQFVVPERGHPLAQVLSLGVIHVSLASLTLLAVASVVLASAGTFSLPPGGRRLLRGSLAALFVVFGLRLALGARG
jgi:threonine/homoserine/homoserine lactone efflux protein